MKTKLLWLVAIVVSLNGCAMLQYTPPPPVQKTRAFQRPFNEVWNATLEGLVKRGENLTLTDKTNGLIRIASRNTQGDYWALNHLANGMVRNDVEWQAYRVEGTFFIKPLTETTSSVTANFKIIARGKPEIWINNDNQPATGKDIRKGNAHIEHGHPEEFELDSNGNLEQAYFEMIAGGLLAARDAGI